MKNKIFADPLFDSEKIEFNDINVDEVLDIQHSQLSSRVERCVYEGWGWTINLIIQHKLVISEIAPCEISFYFPLPKELRNQVKGFINNQNEGNQCFRWCLFRYILQSENPAKIRNVDR